MGTFDPKAAVVALAVDIAREHPLAVLAAIMATPTAPTLTPVDWLPEARRLCDIGQKVAAIKHCRNATGWGLKDAKDAVDVLCRSPQPARHLGDIVYG